MGCICAIPASPIFPPGPSCAAIAAIFSSHGNRPGRIKRYQKETRLDSAYVFFVLRQSDDALLGGCTLSNVRRGVTQCCTLGYWVGARFARQGYMTAAVKALIPFIFKTLGLHRIEAACLTDNEASKNLLARTGFQQEGLARRYLLINGKWADHLLFAQLKDEAV